MEPWIDSDRRIDSVGAFVEEYRNGNIDWLKFILWDEMQEFHLE